jgi:hypothetical protein
MNLFELLFDYPIQHFIRKAFEFEFEDRINAYPTFEKDMITYISTTEFKISRLEVGTRALFYCARFGLPKVLRFLLLYKDQPELDPLITAFDNMHSAMKEYALIDEIATFIDPPFELPNLDMKDYSDTTPLMLACYYSEPRIVRQLLREHIDIECRNECHETALHIAIRFYSKRNYENVVQLINAGANVNAVARGYRTPLLLSIEYNVPHISFLLLETNRVDHTIMVGGKNVLDLCLEDCRNDRIRLLLEHEKTLLV